LILDDNSTDVSKEFSDKKFPKKLSCLIDKSPFFDSNRIITIDRHGRPEKLEILHHIDYLGVMK